MEVVKAPEILLPKPGIDYHKWAVIACDQFTSEIAYWNQVHQLVDNVPSTYHLILPEAYLDMGFETRIKSVNENMDLYLRNNLFQKHTGLVLVDRTTPFQPHRLGLVVMIDLDEYQYQEGVKGQVVASEKTVLSRIPPRVKIREAAPIEVPHILVLIDDIEGIIPDLYRHRDEFEKLYDFDLNMGGGHVKGYLVKDYQSTIAKINALIETSPLVVGDGNHSLAAAKECWKRIKAKSTPEELNNHPARYAMVELTSIYDKGLVFEPIHRVLFHVDEDQFLHEVNRTSHGSEPLKVITPEGEGYILTPTNPFETISWVQDFLDNYLVKHPEVDIDYVHGLDSLMHIIEENDKSLGITLPHLDRSQLFAYIKQKGVLPRKSFSLGEALEKRYYLESRIIQKGKM